jgi:cell division protein FtsZ
MRGARGLLISISGGPDLTLYEVDEAATRIREEVDPEANIILGATFDDSLEGTMRVSVVATGLAQELLTSAIPPEGDEEMPEAGKTSFGYTGKQQAAAPKVVTPAPMAARANPVANKPPAPPKPTGVEEEIDNDHAAQTAAKAAPKMRSQRIPPIEEFPPIAQKQIAAQQNRIEHIAEHAARKKKGLFERLAMSVWAQGRPGAVRGNLSWRPTGTESASYRQTRQAPAEPQPTSIPTGLINDYSCLPAVRLTDYSAQLPLAESPAGRIHAITMLGLLLSRRCRQFAAPHQNNFETWDTSPVSCLTLSASVPGAIG